MLLLEKKLEKRLLELAPYRYIDKKEIDYFLIREDEMGVSNPPVPKLGEEDKRFCKGDGWCGRDAYLWMQTSLRLPKEWKDLEPKYAPVGLFHFGGEFEAMLYIEGEPYQGVDNNHAEVFFKEEHFDREITLTFRLWSGLEDGGVPTPQHHCFVQAELALLDMAADDFFHLGMAVLSTAKIMSNEQAEREDYLAALDKAFLLIDWTDAGGEAFYQMVHDASACLSQTIDAMPKATSLMVSCVGHTHIDTAWMWRLKHTREKASRSFSTVLRLMERFPEYLFLHTQPQQYAFIKEDFPQIYEQIQERVKEGRWEIDGAMWVESDCNLPNGESLTRQVLLGRKFMLEEFGKEPTYLWLPDAFGYSAALPQILKKSGIETFMTSKIMWNQYNRMPNDTFWWEGIDGSKILAHFLTTPNPGPKVYDNYFFIYNGFLYPDTVTGAWKLYQEKRLNKDILISYGYGDGGGGVSREMLEYRRNMDKLPGLPNVKTSSAGDYFKRLHKTVENTTQPMATWDGEIYLEYHRGTFTSQAYNKKMNRLLENLYQKAEWLTAMAAVKTGDISKAEQEKLTEGWKIILTHQFHDIIPGSAIHEVYEDSVVNYMQAQDLANEVISDAYTNLIEQDAGYSILNPVAEKRSGMVRLAEATSEIAGKEFYTEDGKTVSTQIGADGVWAYVENVPAMGAMYLYARDVQDKRTQAACSRIDSLDGKIHLVTPYYELELNEDGQISYLYDRAYDSNVLEENACGNVLQFFEDKPIDFDAWDIDMFYQEKKREVTNLVKREIVENGTLRTVIRQEWSISKSHICQDMILYANTGRIDFKTHVNWQETQKLLKVAFPVDIRANYATYDIQYGNIKRPNHSNTSWERAKFEVVGHRFADLSEHDYGVSLLNDCKYGYDIHQNVMRLSLLKSAIYPDLNADKGEHDFTYAIYPHKGDFVTGSTVQQATELNQPLEALRGRISLPCNDGGSSVRFTGSCVELDALKKSEDGKYLLLRFHEYAGSKGKVKMEFGFIAKAICECDLMERPLEEFKQAENMMTCIKPYEVKTFLIQL